MLHIHENVNQSDLMLLAVMMQTEGNPADEDDEDAPLAIEDKKPGEKIKKTDFEIQSELDKFRQQRREKNLNLIYRCSYGLSVRRLMIASTEGRDKKPVVVQSQQQADRYVSACYFEDQMLENDVLVDCFVSGYKSGKRRREEDAAYQPPTKRQRTMEALAQSIFGNIFGKILPGKR